MLDRYWRCEYELDGMHETFGESLSQSVWLECNAERRELKFKVRGRSRDKVLRGLEFQLRLLGLS